MILRNYEGMLIRYQAEDKPATTKPTATRGVSGLLTGSKTALIPEGTERMARRAAHAAEGGCCGSAEPAAERPGAVSLPVVNGNGNGHHPAPVLQLYATGEGGYS